MAQKQFNKNYKKPQKNKKKSSKPQEVTVIKKTLEDYRYDIGSSKNGSEYVSTTKFIIHHIATTFDEADDIATALSDGKDFDLDAVRPSLQVSLSKDSEVQKRETRQFELVFEKEADAHVARTNKYRQNKPKAAAIILGRCTDRLKSKLQQRKDWDRIEKDPVRLLAAIKEHAMNYETTQYKMKTIADALKGAINLRQREEENLTDYLKRRKAVVEVFYSHAGKQFCFPRMVESHPEYLTLQQQIVDAIDPNQKDECDQASSRLREIKRDSMQEFMGFLFMDNSDKSKYGSLMSGLETQHSLGNDQYPKSLVDAYTVLGNHSYDQEYYKAKEKRNQKAAAKKESNSSPKNDENKDSAAKLSMSFSQLKKKNVCNCCGKTHALTDCPLRNTTPKQEWHINKLKQTKTVSAYNQIVDEMKSVMFPNRSTAPTADSSVTSASTTTTYRPDQTWQLFTFVGAGVDSGQDYRNTFVLDSGSSIDLFCNEKFLKNVQPAKDAHTMQTNAGDMDITKQGLLESYGTVPFNDQAMTNIMSLANCTDRYRVTFDSAIDNAFYVHTPQKVVRFGRNEANLYVHKPTQLGQDNPNIQDSRKRKDPPEASFVQTVEENMKFHTPREIKRAKQASDLLAAIGSPNVHELKALISMNAIGYNPV